MNKISAVFTGHKLCFWYVFSIPLIYWNTADLVLHWRWNFLPERASCDFKIIRTHRVQDIVSIWYVASRKLCLVVDSQVKIWHCTLSYKNCHLTLLCLQHHFGTTFCILTIFAKFNHYFDFDKLAITLQPSKNEELCPFPILIEKYRVPQLHWCEKSQSS